MADDRLVYTLLRGTDIEPPMRLEIRDGMIVFTEDRGSDDGMTIIRMTPHRARAVGERLMAMADGIVAAEND